MRIAILPLGRPTFDVDYAREKLDAVLAQLDSSEHEIIGSRELLLDGEATLTAIRDAADANPDRLLILQITFTDAAMTVEAARNVDSPMAIWAVPEPRTGGRLRLNAFCGLNLASHALGLNHRRFGWAYAEGGAADLDALLDETCWVAPIAAPTAPKAEGRSPLEGRRIARIGAHPDGFDTCAYDDDALSGLAGVKVDALELDDLFSRAKEQPAHEVAALDETARYAIGGMDDVDAGELDKSLRLKLALDSLREENGYDAFAIRCWPETFTEYGGAVCGPVSLLGEARVPCACEADVYGAVTQLLLQKVAEAPVFLTDIVDMDEADDTGVVWHCGQAPLSMAAEETPPSATIHTNRKMPLLAQFALKPGRVTFVRISQAFGETSMVLASGEMLERPMAYTGTSGVVRFDKPITDVLPSMIGCGLEHHMALAYGDHADALEAAAKTLGLGVTRLA
ncbi:L-fucose/L-arabinose isomerase family protein [Ahrensia sp. R2A130]|uniref:L-fucose/L-arabinose isomerase family protein n=1 Tax=Ahrensia sp. R2A130 TaxID=744979 RepID=UPI0001E0ACCC|nr:hypothetical protein [Ahrensia sp. R2A130]EFL88445.1 conserved hypothetical protein [Ahrensia sp. R2A130]